MIFYRMMRRNAAKLTGDRSAMLDLAHGRLVVLSSFFAIIYMVLAVRAFDISVVQAKFWNMEDAGAIVVAEAPEGKRRGSIYDRNGNMLATSLDMASLYADPYLIADPEKTARGLSEIFPSLNFGKTLRSLQSARRFVWIERNISPRQQEAVMQLGEPGLAFRYEEKRVYPAKNEMAHLVGMTNVDGRGLAGVERSFDRMLAKGQDVTLSLDMRLQHALHREVGKAIDDFNAMGGAGVIMDAHTGEVLAGVSLPDFNPHEPGLSEAAAHFNRLTLGVYELGSVFKIFSTAAFLETHDVPMSTTFDAREPIKVGRFTISDYHAEERILTVPEVFMVSSNIGSAMMGQAVGGQRLRQFYEDLGLLSAMNVEVAEVASPLVPDRWGEVATMTASYGHGIATTPLNVAAAVATVVNGGYLIEPTFVHAGEGDKVRDNRNKISVISEETSYKMRELMRLVVTDGTGKNADVPGYRLGGKTGTAEKSGAGGYQRKKLISSFVGAFPINDPRYVVMVAVDEPKGNKKSYGYATAGWVAAPAVQRLVKTMANILGMAPDYDAPSYEHPLRQYVALEG